MRSVAALADLLAFRAQGPLYPCDPWLLALPPPDHLAWALVRGVRGGRYTCPFTDPATNGWSVILAFVTGITAGFVLFGRLIVRLDGRCAPITDR